MYSVFRSDGLVRSRSVHFPSGDTPRVTVPLVVTGQTHHVNITWSYRSPMLYTFHHPNVIPAHASAEDRFCTAGKALPLVWQINRNGVNHIFKVAQCISTVVPGALCNPDDPFKYKALPG